MALASRWNMHWVGTTYQITMSLLLISFCHRFTEDQSDAYFFIYHYAHNNSRLTHETMNGFLPDNSNSASLPCRSMKLLYGGKKGVRARKSATFHFRVDFTCLGSGSRDVWPVLWWAHSAVSAGRLPKIPEAPATTMYICRT